MQGFTALAFADFLSPAAVLLVGSGFSKDGGSGPGTHKIPVDHIHEIHSSIFHKILEILKKLVQHRFFDWQETSDSTARYSKKRSIINLNDRGAILEGTSLIHPDDFADVKQILCENLDSFKKKENKIFLKRRSIQGLGLVQILTILVTICDQVRKHIDQSKESNFGNVLKEILSNKDNASLLVIFVSQSCLH